MNWDDLETFTRKPRTRRKKKKRDLDTEELDFRYFADEITLLSSVHPDVIEQMENRLRQIKKEEDN